MKETTVARRPKQDPMSRIRAQVPPKLSDAFCDDDVWLATRSLVNVLITAEDRATREGLVRFIHDHGAHREGPLVTVQGHATRDVDLADGDHGVDRWFQQARGGTLFVDDVHRLGQGAQARLFWLLEEGTVLSLLGEDARRHVDALGSAGAIRVVAGTTADMQTEIAAGAFSEVLFYRLNVIHLSGTPRSAPRSRRGRRSDAPPPR